MDELKKAKIEMKKRELKGKATEMWNKTKNFVGNNKETLAVAIPIVIGSGTKIVSAIKRHESIKTESRHRELDHYDPRTGTWSHAKRKLSKRERLELDDRYSKGESKIRILQDMGVLR